MKTHTSDLKNNIKKIGRVLDSKITYTLNNEEIVLGMTDLNSVTPSYTTSLLKSVMKQLDIDSNVEIPEGTIINYQLGVLVNGSFEYLNYGNYVVYKVEKQEDVRSYKITCYDKMLYAMKDYKKIVGKNLFSSEFEQGTIAGADGQPIVANNRVRTIDFINAEANQTYTLSVSNTNLLVYVFQYQSDGTYVSRIPSTWATFPYTFTTDNNISKIKIIITYANGDEILPEDITNIQLEKGNQATLYMPYFTYPINIKNYLKTLCYDLGLEFKDSNFANQNREIANELYLDSNGNSLGYTFRDVLDEIAQATASNICIDETTDKLEVRYISKNLWQIANGSSANGITLTKNNDGTFNLIGTATARTSFKTWIPLEKIKNNTNYTLSSDYIIEGLDYRFEEYSAIDGSWIKQYNQISTTYPSPRTTKVVKGNGTYVRLAIFVENGITVNKNNIHLNLEETPDEINEEFFKDINVNFGEKYGPVNSIVLSRAGDSDNVYLQDETSIEENGLCEIKISDNQIMNWNDRSGYLPDILSKLNGLEYYLNDYSSTGIFYYNICDRYNASIDGNIYSCVMFNDEVNITQGAEEIIYTDMPKETQTDYFKADKTDRKINQTYIMVDKQNGRIDALASSVQDLTTFLKTVEGTGMITLENTADSNGAIGRLEITGLSGTSSDYIIVQENEDGTEHNETVVSLSSPLVATDKLIIDNNKVYIERTNSNIATDTEVVLKTFEGETKIWVKYFNNANIKCQYIEKNDFTKYFATQAELSSSIIITDEQISSKVSKEEVISEINQSAEKIELRANRLVVESDNFNLTEDGKITSISGSIGGFNIDGTDGFVYKIYAPYDYNQTDLSRIQSILRQEVTPTQQDYLKYDLDNDGTITSADYLRVSWYVREGITTSNYGKFEISIPKENRLTSARTGYIDAYDRLASGFNYNNVISENLSIRFEGNETITARGSNGNITCVSLTQTSKEEAKKNFEKLKNAKEILKATDIYKYNLKNENDEDKKHIGFVIGNKYNYSEEITSKDNDGANIYSMVSVLWQVVKEQQEEIEKLKEKL